jgi:hypothetical protein
MIWCNGRVTVRNLQSDQPPSSMAISYAMTPLGGV